MPALAVLQDALDDVARLVGFVADGDQVRLRGGCPVGPEVLGEALRGQADHAVGGGEDRLRRAIVPVERDDARRAARTGSGNRGCCGPSRRGTSRSTGHRRRPPSGRGRPGFSASRIERLQAVGVLILVDQDVIEAAADVVGQAGSLDHLRPVEQQIVVIEHVLRLLGLDIGREQLLAARPPIRAPGKDAPSTSSIGISALTQRE